MLEDNNFKSTIVLTDTTGASGLSDYTMWGKKFALYLGEGFEFMSQDLHSIGMVLRYSHKDLFNSTSIFGKSLDFIVRVTDDKTAGELLQARIKPIDGIIPENYCHVSIIQFVEERGLAFGIKYYITGLIQYFIKNYIETLSHNFYDTVEVFKEDDSFNLRLRKYTGNSPELESWNNKSILDFIPINSLISSLSSFGIYELPDKRLIGIESEGNDTRFIGKASFSFKVPEFLEGCLF